jgi:hypothetical protein
MASIATREILINVLYNIIYCNVITTIHIICNHLQNYNFKNRYQGVTETRTHCEKAGWQKGVQRNMESYVK